MALTTRKRQQLHNAILCYLMDQGFEDSAKAFESESGAEPKTNIPQLLETKWLTVLRLQSKILTLQEELQVANSALENAVPYQKRDLDQSLLLPSKCLREMKGHRQPVTCVKFHPKFTWVVSASDDCTIILWDWDDEGKYIRSMRGHTSAVQDLDFDEEGQRLASCSADMSIKIWDMTDDNYKCVRTLQGHDHNVCGVRFFSDRLVSCSRDTTIKIWDMNSGFCVKTLQAHDEWVKCIAVSACHSLIASGSMDKSVRVWSIAKGSWENSQVYRDHNHVVECVAFSNSSADKVLTNTEDSKEEFLEGEGSQRPRFLASGSRDRSICIFDMEMVKCICVLKGHDNWVRGIQWHPAGKFLVSCADDKTIRIWDLVRRQEKSSARLERAHRMFVQTMHYSLISALVVTGGADNVVKVWECE